MASYNHPEMGGVKAPPVPPGMVRVCLTERGYYEDPSWAPWSARKEQSSTRTVDIPVDQLARWQRAGDSYHQMLVEIEALTDG